MTLPLLYANNADVKYPLSDFHETDVPNDILLDLCLNIDPAYTPVVGAVRITPYLAFLSIEDETTGEPLYTAFMSTPVRASSLNDTTDASTAAQTAPFL